MAAAKGLVEGSKVVNVSKDILTT